jgi:hypothetical protein
VVKKSCAKRNCQRLAFGSPAVGGTAQFAPGGAGDAVEESSGNSNGGTSSDMSSVDLMIITTPTKNIALFFARYVR